MNSKGKIIKDIARLLAEYQYSDETIKALKDAQAALSTPINAGGKEEKCDGNCGMNYCDEYGCVENKPDGIPIPPSPPQEQGDAVELEEDKLANSILQLHIKDRPFSWSLIIAAMKEYASAILEQQLPEEKEYDPYWYWPQCDVEGCEGVSGYNGIGWKETGYWCLCSDHARDFREGKPQPQMKQSAIDKEATRDKVTGCLPSTNYSKPKQ